MQRLLAGGMAVGLVLCALGSAQILRAGEREEFRELLGKLARTQGELRSGRGKATWKMTTMKEELKEIREKEISFAFDGEKLRYDTTKKASRRMWEDGRVEETQPGSPNRRQHAEDGEYFYEYLCYPHDYEAGGVANVYLKEAGHLKGGELYGHRFDVKWLMNPEGGSIQELLSVMDSLPVEVEMERTGDGLVEAGLKSTETGDVWRLLFEERKSFNIVLEESLRGDKVRSRIERTFKEREGVWYIDSYVHDSYASIPPDVFPERIEFRIEEIEVNVEVPGETFSYRGFGLPARIHVWDSAKGVDYEAGPGVITARDAEKLPGFTEKGAAEGGEEEGREEGRAETEGSVQVAEGGEAEEEGAQGGASAQWKFRWPVAATAVAALLMLAIAERVVRRRAGRRSSSRRTRYGAIRR